MVASTAGWQGLCVSPYSGDGPVEDGGGGLGECAGPVCDPVPVDYAADSVRAALKRPDIFSPLAYLPHLQLHRKQQTWLYGLEQSGVVADAKLIPCRTLCASEDRILTAR
ncbi:hypothetical protein D1007_45262 [Hordeum vulgare]|nr:hypothetical protein D1007_45262 [Hordeum vulgare]